MNKEYLKNIDKVKELNIFFFKEYKKQIDFKNNNDNTFTITLYNSLA